MKQSTYILLNSNLKKITIFQLAYAINSKAQWITFWTKLASDIQEIVQCKNPTLGQSNNLNWAVTQNNNKLASTYIAQIRQEKYINKYIRMMADLKLNPR